MSNHSHHAHTDELKAFVRHVLRLMDEEYPHMREAGIELLVPAESKVDGDTDDIGLTARNAAAESTSGDCDCPPGWRCKQRVPSGRFVCVPK